MRSFLILPLVLMLNLILLCGCHRNEQEDRKFGVLFDGFHLVKVDDLDPKADIDLLDTATLHDTSSGRGGFEPGKVYVLKKDRTWDNGFLAAQIFPDRLRQMGAKVVRAPASGAELMCWFVGPMRYKIEFKYKGRQGFILNHAEYNKRRDDLEEVVLLVCK
jgi:hypothetical protein